MSEVQSKGYLQIAWTIAAKDIFGAVKNKAILIFLFLTAVMILMNNISFSKSANPEIVIYSKSHSDLLQKLNGKSGLEISIAGSFEDMEKALGSGNEVVLGLHIPGDVEDEREADSGLILQGYVIHWAGNTQVGRLKTQVEREIEEILGRDVTIQVEGNRVYSQPGLFGHAWEVSFSMVLVLSFLALFLVPNLVVVEKRTRTMDSLLISPASTGQIILGKALAGGFYYLVAVGVILALNWRLVVHLEVLSLTLVSGGLFCIGLGLLLGYLIDRQVIVNATSYALLVGLMAPVFMILFTPFLPSFVGNLLEFVPTVSFTKLLELAFSGGMFVEKILLNGAILLLTGALVWVILIWRARGMDR